MKRKVNRKVHIKRFDTTLPLPKYQTKGAVAFDCHARARVMIAPQSTALVPLNIALKPPKQHCVLVAARSSLYKRGLLMVNGVGIIDEDYCGDNDEYRCPILNFTSAPVTIERGDRIAQALFLKYTKANLHEVKKLSKKSRGGFGSTGK